jgi:hypothetical protein
MRDRFKRSSALLVEANRHFCIKQITEEIFCSLMANGCLPHHLARLASSRSFVPEVGGSAFAVHMDGIRSFRVRVGGVFTHRRWHEVAFLQIGSVEAELADYLGHSYFNYSS